MLPYEEQDITVWTTVRTENRTCEYGGKHYVYVCAPKRLGPVVGTRMHDNGYEKRMTALRLDAQGRTYHQHIEIDYGNNVSWVRDGDKAWFKPRLPHGGIDIRTEWNA